MTRQRLIDALEQVYRDGHAAPSASFIAARADVARRTLYLHFPHLEDLHEAALQQAVERHEATSVQTACDDSLQCRIDALCSRRAQLAEDVLPFVRARHRRMSFGTERSAALLARAELTDRDVDHAFGPELAPLAAADRRRIRHAVQLCCSTGGWERLRDGLSLRPNEAAAALSAAVGALLRDARETAGSYRVPEQPVTGSGSARRRSAAGG